MSVCDVASSSFAFCLCCCICLLYCLGHPSYTRCCFNSPLPSVLPQPPPLTEGVPVINFAGRQMRKTHTKQKAIFGRRALLLQLATTKTAPRNVGSKSFSSQKNWQQITITATPSALTSVLMLPSPQPPPLLHLPPSPPPARLPSPSTSCGASAYFSAFCAATAYPSAFCAVHYCRAV